jgi:hypothetical protein
MALQWPMACRDDNIEASDDGELDLKSLFSLCILHSKRVCVLCHAWCRFYGDGGGAPPSFHVREPRSPGNRPSGNSTEVLGLFRDRRSLAGSVLPRVVPMQRFASASFAPRPSVRSDCHCAGVRGKGPRIACSEGFAPFTTSIRGEAYSENPR